MRDLKKYRGLLRYMVFRRWWSRLLNSIPSKLIDLKTRKDMSIIKRIQLITPKMEELCLFLNDIEADFLIKNDKEHKHDICEISLLDKDSGMHYKIRRVDKNTKVALYMAIENLLKEKEVYDNNNAA